MTLATTNVQFGEQSVTVRAEGGAGVQLLRRIAIGHHSSMQVDLDAQHPLGVPEVRFLGADSVITPLRDRF